MDMRVTFPRLPDNEAAYALVERDDGVVYRLYGGRAGSSLPREIEHLVVERSLGITDGVWAGVAAGMQFGSMRAELLAELVKVVAALDDPSPAEIIRVARVKLSVLSPSQAPVQSGVDPAAIKRAAQELQVEAARWARLRVGQSLSYDWPPPRHGRVA